MQTRIIGDIHGKIASYRDLLDGVDNSIQVGDFGIGFGGPYWNDVANRTALQGNHRFIRGNHDSPSQCKDFSGWIPDGLVEDNIMFVGGAWSIDHAYRTEGIDWWTDEECSIAQFNTIIDTYASVRPEIMITHDAPDSITSDMFIKAGLAMGGSQARSISTRTGHALQS
jgi:hypothetical protein